VEKVQGNYNSPPLNSYYVNIFASIRLIQLKMRTADISPDWLLIYKVTKKEIIFERTGSHSELLKK